MKLRAVAPYLLFLIVVGVLHLAVRDPYRIYCEDIEHEFLPMRAYGYQHPWEAFNLDRNQAVAGLDGPGVAVSGTPLWATFIYKVSPDASGVFTVDLLHSDADPGQRSYLFATGSHEGIAISHTGTAQIRVLP